ncbi:DUF3137 domain-containing protein [Agathobacter rectalis]|uniref:DUF3137 domain-containing protein n=1 Tax=Agathobacter rectalis TaxID=39491 RepID=UPI0027D30F90|nr:DUF3137 domain-containing protein [Agathobacter rectalis]MCB7108818.1 DUF3137 domain-containing protein [Agathobacter rectalis]MCG4812111.1 DUF3137 domain-containing protein [Agathobacter rectalis]
MRYDLTKEIKITPEMEEQYDKGKKLVIATSRLYGFLAVAAFLAITGLNNLNSLCFALTFIGIALLIAIPSIIKYFKVKDALGITDDVEEEYLNSCVLPIVEQIDSNVKVSKDIKSYPDYKYKNAQDLGNWFVTNYIMPSFNSTFEIDTVINTLSTNDDGFIFFNAEATSRHSDSDGHTTTTTDFKGTIITLKTKLNTTSNVSLYTSGKIFGKETCNGYRKIKDTIDTENEEFNKSFQVTSEEQSQGFYVLSPLVMENLLKIKELYGSYGLFVHNGYLTFAFKNGKKLDMPDETKKAKKMSLEQSVKDMMDMLNMVYKCKDAIDLNADKNFNI